MFNVSERHIRRVETIRKTGGSVAARLESIAMRGGVSLETVEHLILHSGTADALEAVWLTASKADRAEFLNRIRETDT